MAVYFLVYALEDGVLRRPGFCTSVDQILQAQADEGIIVSSEPLFTKVVEERPGVGRVTVDLPDIDAVRSTLSKTVDALAAQAIDPWRPIYPAKETEARELLAGTRTVAAAPMIAAQASITGQEPTVIAQSIVEAADAYALRSAQIEGKRSAAKYLISQETNLGALAAAANVDLTA